MEEIKFVEPTGPLWPPTNTTWSNALASVRRTDPPPANDLPRGYAFPDAALFIGVQKPEKTYAYLRQWLKYQTALIFRLIPDDNNAHPLSSDHWCSFLSKSMENDNQNDWCRAKKATMRELLGTVIENFDSASDSLKSDLCFKGQPITSKGAISPGVVQEILWEISELNFRVKLSALHHYASGVAFDNARSSILNCLPSCPGNIYVVNFDKAGEELASGNIQDRAPYVLALHELMTFWKSDTPLGNNIPESVAVCTDRHLLDIERRVAEFYMQTFYEYFGRACTLPCRPH